MNIKIKIIIVFAVIIAGFFGASHIIKASDNTICSLVQKQRAINNVHNCDVTPINIWGMRASLVSISYGQGMDCSSGCIYEGFTGFVLNGIAFNHSYKPTINLALQKQYGQWCLADNPYQSQQSYKLTLNLKNEFVFTFDNFDNSNIITALLEKSDVYQSLSEYEYCKFNGSLTVKSLESTHFASEVDYSNLEVIIQPYTKTSPVSTEDLMQSCIREVGRSASSSMKIKNQCLYQVAQKRADDKLCNQIINEDSLKNLCLTEVGFRQKNNKMMGSGI